MKFALPKVGRPSFSLPRVTLSGRFGVLRAALARFPRPGDRFERFAWIPGGIVIATVVVVGAVFSATVQSSDNTLVIMGFDPDRAQLITALIVGATAAALAMLLVNRTTFSVALGTFALVALFAQTFAAETQNAVSLTGPAGSFDVKGWVLTIVTLVTIGVICAWIGATLGASVRPGLISSSNAVLDMARDRRLSRRLSRGPVAALVTVIILALTVPAFGDMVNLSPDALMLNGDQVARPAQSLSPIALASATPSQTPTLAPRPSGSGAAATAGPTPTPVRTAAPGTKPWLAWKPAGVGQVTLVNMPAPWNGGTKRDSEIDIYTPAGYDPSGDRLYPVLYEAPTGLALWGKGTGAISTLDTMIASGDMPATIVVFIDSLGSPYGDTQCADMFDGRQWFETYMSKTVVQFVDDHYKTIKDRLGRGIMGMSAGGFCSAMLTLRHPDVFSISVSFSGYFTAGGSGPSSEIPFGGADGVQQHSPVFLAAQTPQEYRSSLYFIVIACESQLGACPKQEFYATHAAQFEGVLKANGIKYLNTDSPYTHGWPQVRYESPAVFAEWGAQLVVNGIW
jgi:S-formylglutathione hydrolase FrmB